MTSKRTAKDEYQLDEQLRQQEDIKDEVIAELQHENEALWRSQVTLLQALIADGKALHLYRLQALGRAEKAVQREGGHCTPWCQRHDWDSTKGWLRTDKE